MWTAELPINCLFIYYYLQTIIYQHTMLDWTHLRKPKCAKLCIYVNHRKKVYFKKVFKDFNFMCESFMLNSFSKNVVFCPLRKHFKIVFFNVNKISHVQIRYFSLNCRKVLHFSLVISNYRKNVVSTHTHCRYG